MIFICRKPDPIEMKMEQDLNETGLLESSQQIPLPSTSSHELSSMNDLTFSVIKPEPDDMAYNVNKTSQRITNQQIPLPSPLKSEDKKEVMNCQFCPYSDDDLGRLKFHAVTQHPTGAAVVRFGESYQHINFFCVKETCNFSTTICTVYKDHLRNCYLPHQTLSGKEKERLKSTLQFAFDFYSHCIRDITSLLEYFSSINKTYIPEDDHVQLRKDNEHSIQLRKDNEHSIQLRKDNEHSVQLRKDNEHSIQLRKDNEHSIQLRKDNEHSIQLRKDNEHSVQLRKDNEHSIQFRKDNEHSNLFSNMSTYSSLSDVQSSLICEDVGEKNLEEEGPFSLIPNPVPVLIVQNQNKGLIENHSANASPPARIRMENNGHLMKTSPSELMISKSQVHALMGTQTGKKPFSCVECDKCFPYRSDFLKHKRIHSGEKPFKCEVCAKSFSKSHQLTVHKRTHTGEKPFKCSVCDKAFSQSQHLITHKTIHTGEKPFTCHVCNKRFNISSNLHRHMKIIHSYEKPFIYNDACHLGFTKSFYPLTHSKRTHSSNKPFKCNKCDESFSDSPALVAHERIHTGQKPFKCDVCYKDFDYSSLFIAHKRTHTGEKPFKCNVCDKGFANGSGLIRHKRIHTGEKPYKCNVCNRGFTDSSSSIRHRRTHKGEKPLNVMCDNYKIMKALLTQDLDLDTRNNHMTIMPSHVK